MMCIKCKFDGEMNDFCPVCGSFIESDSLYGISEVDDESIIDEQIYEETMADLDIELYKDQLIEEQKREILDEYAA